MLVRCSRRAFLRGGMGAMAAAMLPSRLAAQGADAARSEKRRMRLILLGTKGGPRPGGRHAPSQVIVVNDVPYVVDCGNGVA